jgi:uncharacterized protein (TIGR02466 family)
MDIAQLFSTPIASFDFSERRQMNSDLASLLLEESLRKPSIGISNIGGWHSENNLHERSESCFRQLVEMVEQNAWRLSTFLLQRANKSYPPLKVKLSMWAMVMRQGDYTKPHTHSNAHWAVVYYPDVGDVGVSQHKNSGDISFIDPRLAYLPIPGIDAETGEFQVEPKTGQMLIFPGWLTHYVHLYSGTKPRISIACNVTYT